MTPEDGSLVLTRPVSVLYRDVQLDGKALSKSLFKSVSHFVGGKPEDLIADGGEALSALGLGKEPGQAAWLLVHAALARAMRSLTEANADRLPKRPSSDAFADEAGRALDQVSLTLDRAFFDRPRELPVVPIVRDLFERWLNENGMEPARAKTVADRLPAYFVYELVREWREQRTAYAALQQSALDTPFDDAAERERAWTRYYDAVLRKQIEEDLLGETFSLSQVYIDLRAYHEKPEKDRPEKDRRDDNYSVPGRGVNLSKRVVVDLQTALDAWVRAADRNDAIRIVSGGPGSGKSSFAKMFAARQCDNPDLRVLFVPLHQFDPKGDLTSAVGDWVREADLFDHNPLDPDKGERRLLLIFDGLDELAMQGRAAEEVARNFVQEVVNRLETRNLSILRVQVLLSGREVVVQGCESILRRPDRVLHVLPYYVSDQERTQYEDRAALREDQRQQWWQRYGAATGKNYTDLPDALRKRGDELDEITAQPLLNYLVALSYERGKIDFARDDVNLNAVYEDLLDAVYERGYGGRQHPAIVAMGRDRFVRVLEEIGLAAWHGTGRTTTVREIRRHCETANLSGLLDKFQEGAEAGVTRLLTAFYFRQYGSSDEGERTFEFTHKSFGEYLTARRIVRGLRRMEQEARRRKEDIDDGWDERSCLKHWAELCGPTLLDRSIARFVKNEVRRENETTAGAWQTLLCNLIGFLLRQGMPMEQIPAIKTYHDMVQQSAHAEYALLVALSACAFVTGQKSDVDWPDEFSADDWLTRLQGEIGLSQWDALPKPLTLLVLNRQTMRADLSEADLSEADLSEADLSRANLSRANLSNANLSNANLRRADLILANLFNANLNHADLSYASLNHAYLIGTNLSEADLSEARLSAAHLNEADLNGTYLNGTDLRGADLRGAIGLETVHGHWWGTPILTDEQKALLQQRPDEEQNPQG